MRINVRSLALVLPGLLFCVFFVLVPSLGVLRASLSPGMRGFSFGSDWTVRNYVDILGDSWYVQKIFLFSFIAGAATTFISIILAYPAALYLSRLSGLKKNILLIVVMIPLFTSMIALAFGWMILFRPQGIFNQVLLQARIISAPLKLMYTVTGVVMCMIYIAIPYAVINLLGTLEQIDIKLEEAATNVGANGWQIFSRIILPMSTPGLYASIVVVFPLNFSAFGIPLMIGGDMQPFAGLVVYSRAIEMNNIPLGSTVGVVLVIVSALFIYLVGLALKANFSRLGQRI